MFSSMTTLLLAAGTIVNAVPLLSAVVAVNTTVPSLVEAGILSKNCNKSYETGAILGNATVPRVIQPWEVLLYGNGRMEVVHEDIYKAMLKADDIFNVNASSPEYHATNGTTDGEIQIIDNGNGKSPIDTRCTFYQAVQVTETQNFMDWDIPMSSALRGDATGRTLVAVTPGYQVADAIGVTVTGKYTIVKDFLEASVGISYTKTWTSSYATAYTFGVGAGKWAAVVSNPRVTRRIGRTLEGCVGAMKQTATFTADNHYQGSFNGLNWVQGGITTCERSTYPIKRCVGNGYIY